MKNLNLFNLLLEQLKNNSSVNEDYKYVGTGNPDAKILIIGKETSIPVESNEQKVMEISNYSDWKRIISNYESQVGDWNGSNYSPLYPYKGQQLKIDNGKN